jgi:uracil-DNA glycosylase
MLEQAYREETSISMKPKHIQRLLDDLTAIANTSTIRNPYSCPDCVTNLGAYLRAICNHPYSGHLLVGEAPGHKGCALTGIPFTSQNVLKSSDHIFLHELRPLLTVGGQQAEASASIVWGYLKECDAIPAMWNVFPFHPHKEDDPRSNRKPSRAEVATGTPFLQAILDILCPETVIAVGDVAAAAFSRLLPSEKVICIRHPSFGGKTDFIVGLKAAGVI